MEMAIDIFETFIVNDFKMVKEEVLSLFSTCFFPSNKDNSWNLFAIKIIEKYLGKNVNNK